MAAKTESRLPEPYRPASMHVGDFHVNELAADQAGSLSPFGPDVALPIPLDKLGVPVVIGKGVGAAMAVLAG